MTDDTMSPAATSRGTIKPSKTMILRAAVGKAEGDKNVFELSTGIGNGSPIVRCEETGKWFLLSWQDIINLAVDAGITKEDEDDVSGQTAEG